LAQEARELPQGRQQTETLEHHQLFQQLPLLVVDSELMLPVMVALAVLVVVVLRVLVVLVMEGQETRHRPAHRKAVTVEMDYQIQMVVGLVVAVERLLLVVMQLQRQARVAQVEMVQHPQLVVHL
jgi:hypothetical protein